jgi:hypothetical protein
LVLTTYPANTIAFHPRERNTISGEDSSMRISAEGRAINIAGQIGNMTVSNELRFIQISKESRV